MNVTLTHPVSNFTGNVNLQNGGIVLGFTNGTCALDLDPRFFEELLSAGVGVTIGTPGPQPPYDANTDVVTAAIVGASTSQTSGALRAAYAPSRREFHIDSYGGDPTGAADSTAAWNAALSAMPTVTVYAHPAGPSGATATYPVGTLRLGAGTYKLGTSTATNNIGPFVNVLGSGTNATVLDYRGAGDCVRMYNAVKPTSDTFDDLAAFAGRIDGFTIEGKNSLVGAVGLRYGDTEGGTIGPDFIARNFDKWLSGTPTISLGASAGSGGSFDGTQRWWRVTALVGTGGGQETVTSNEVTATPAANGTQTLTWTAVTGATGYKLYVSKAGGNYALVAQVGAGTLSYTDTGAVQFYTTTRWAQWRSTAGSAGVVFDNQVSWTENMKVWLSTYNCATGVIFSGFGGTQGDASFMYNHMNLKVYSMPGQHGVALTNGAFYVNGQLTIRGNMARSSSPVSTALLLLQGAGLVNGGNHLSPGTPSVIKQCELHLYAELNLAGANVPSTIWQETPWQNVVYNCSGQMSFSGGTWANSNRTPATDGEFAFVYHGYIGGDPSLAPGQAFGVVGGPMRFSPLYPLAGGQFLTASGDISTPYVLTGNTTVSFGSDNPGFPQRKTIVLKQAASGGPYTVTWPHNASPSLTSPTVLWAGGTAPTMTATANAVDVYNLTTADGITWYGTATQNVS